MDSSKNPIEQPQQNSATTRRRRVSITQLSAYLHLCPLSRPESDAWYRRRHWGGRGQRPLHCLTIIIHTNPEKRKGELPWGIKAVANIYSHALQSSGPNYDTLMNYKRSADPQAAARRQSLNEQKPQSGFFGTMWHKYVEPFPCSLTRRFRLRYYY